MKDKIEQLIKWAEVRRSAFTACAKVFTTDRAKFKAVGRLEEIDFFITQLKSMLPDTELPLPENKCKHKNTGFVGVVGEVFCDDCKQWLD